MYYHASKASGITILKPRVSNHKIPLTYFSTKRENVLVYLSNAVEKHCKQVGFEHNGIFRKWASYGFTKDGLLLLEEYYPNATIETYKGESGYIYSVKSIENHRKQADIPDAVITECEVSVTGCEYIPDAYEAIQHASETGKIVLRKYNDNNQKTLNWIKKTIQAEFENAEQEPEYREFLKAKFPFLL